jgi:hypothetical protein
MIFLLLLTCALCYKNEIGDFIEFNREFVSEGFARATMVLLLSLFVNYVGIFHKRISLTVVFMSLIMYFSNRYELKLQNLIDGKKDVYYGFVLSGLKTLQMLLRGASRNFFFLIFLSLTLCFVFLYSMRIAFYVLAFVFLTYVWNVLEAVFAENMKEYVVYLNATMLLLAVLSFYFIGKVMNLCYCFVFSSYAPVFVLVSVEKIFSTDFKIWASVLQAFQGTRRELLENKVVMAYILLALTGFLAQLFSLRKKKDEDVYARPHPRFEGK